MTFLDSLKKSTKVFLIIGACFLGFMVVIVLPIGFLIIGLPFWPGFTLAIVYCILLVATVDYLMDKGIINVR